MRTEQPWLHPLLAALYESDMIPKCDDVLPTAEFGGINQQSNLTMLADE
jgi:hypothetical protein